MKDKKGDLVHQHIDFKVFDEKGLSPQHVTDNLNESVAVSKLVDRRSKISSFNNVERPDDINPVNVSNISFETVKRHEETKILLELFPDLKLSAQIIVAGIISPQDSLKPELIYKLDENILPPNVSSSIGSAIKSTLNKVYRLERDLHKYVHEALFEYGSHVRLVLPENSIDTIINDSITGQKISLESLQGDLLDRNNKFKSLGILGNIKNESMGSTTGLESFIFNGGDQAYEEELLSNDILGKITIHDNFNLLRLPELIAINNQLKVNEKIRGDKNNIGAESFNFDLNEHDFKNRVYKEGSNNVKPFIAFPTAITNKRSTVGRPLVMRVPPEAVIPVHTPSDPTKHIGYFILIDNEGHPLNSQIIQQDQSLFNQRFQAFGQSEGLTNFLTTKASNNLNYRNCKISTLMGLSDIYGSLIESEMKERLSTGVYGSQANISSNQEVYRVMLSRALANQGTRLVYIPAELVGYIAYQFHKNGIGKSMLEELKVLAGVRAILLFSRTMGMIKNSIESQNVEITLDPNDPDPQKTIEIAKNEVLNTANSQFPLGLVDPSDLTNWVRRSGYHFTFSGHPKLPETSININSNAGVDHKIPDIEFDESIRKQTIMSLGLPPEMVDNAFNSDFATIDLTKNVLTAKRFIVMSEEIMERVTDYVKKIIINDETLQTELLTILETNKEVIESFVSDKDWERLNIDNNHTSYIYHVLLQKYLDNLSIEIPKPESEAFEDQHRNFSAYETALDDALEYWMGETVVNSSFAGDLGEHAEELKNIYKAAIMRNWMADNGFMNELGDITTKDEQGRPLLNMEEIMSNHLKGILESAEGYIKKIKEVKTNMNKTVEEEISNTGGGF